MIKRVMKFFLEDYKNYFGIMLQKNGKVVFNEKINNCRNMFFAVINNSSKYATNFIGATTGTSH